MKDVKFGVILSYISIFISMMYGFFLTPYIMRTIGIGEYGVYKSVAAMTSSIGILEFGTGRTMQRYIAKFLAEEKREEAFNFSAMGIIQASVLALGVIFVGIIAFFSIDNLYSATFNSREMVRAQQLFVMLVLSLIIQIFENVIYGVATGYNKFIFLSGIKVISMVIRILLLFVILPVFKNAIVLVLITIIIQLSVMAIYIFYTIFKLKHKFRLYKWDGKLFKESFCYTILLFAQSLIMQLNGNLDNVAIGALVGTTAVTVYSFALQIFGMYEQCATSVSSVALPMITNKIYKGATTEDLEETIVKFGRVQWIFLGAALFGFICFGREFFYLWLGNNFDDCWYLCIILMVPVTFPLVVNICLTILKAKNLLTFRTVSMAYSAVFNALVTFIGTRYWGYWAAAIGTAGSTIIGSVISLNIYYWKKLEINVFKLYLAISKRITICLIITALLTVQLNAVLYGTWMTFALKAIVFCFVYGVLLLLFGLNKDEKKRFLKKGGKA